MKSKRMALSFGLLVALSGAANAGLDNTGIDTINKVNAWEDRADVVLKNRTHSCPAGSDNKTYTLMYGSKNGSDQISKNGSDQIYSALLAALMSGNKVDLRFECDVNGATIKGVRLSGS